MNSNHQNKILIADENSEIRSTNAELFRSKNYEVLEAEDGVEALALLNNEARIDIVLTSIDMPRMDGFELVKNIKEQEKKIPIVVYSHLGNEEDRERMEDLRADDFVVQGVDSPAELVKKVAALVKQGEYLLKVNPIELDGPKMIDDFNFPGNFKCKNCSAELGLKVKFNLEQEMKAKVVCPECGLEY